MEYIQTDSQSLEGESHISIEEKHAYEEESVKTGKNLQLNNLEELLNAITWALESIEENYPYTIRKENNKY